jgi:hypothetical protein
VELFFMLALMALSLEERGYSILIFGAHAPCSSFIHLIPVVDPGRASKFHIAYRGESPLGQLSSCYSEYVMLACKLVLT